VRFFIRVLNAKGEGPAEIRKQIVAVYGKLAISTCFFTERNISLGKSSTTMMRCKKKPWRGSMGRRQTSVTRGYRSWFQDLMDNAGNYVEK